MSQDPTTFQFPFTLRDMLHFENGTAFSLKLQTQVDTPTTVTIRGMTREGLFTLKYVDNGDSSVHTSTYRIPDIPILVSISNDTGSLNQGQCYATLSLVANGDAIATLCSGLVYQGHGVAYPAGNLPDQRPGGGLIASTVGANPAAGAEWQFTVPLGEIWRVMSIEARLVAAAAAASRRVHIRFSDSQSIRGIDVFSNTDQIINETKDYSCVQLGSIQAETNGNFIMINLPNNLFMKGGSTIGSLTVNIQAGDDWATPVITYEKFFLGT